MFSHDKIILFCRFYCNTTTTDVIKILSVIINHIYYIEQQFYEIKEFAQNELSEEDITDIQYAISIRKYLIRSHKTAFSMLIKKNT